MICTLDLLEFPDLSPGFAFGNGGVEGRGKQGGLGVRQGEAGGAKKSQGEAGGARGLIPQNLTADANQSNSSCRTQL